MVKDPGEMNNLVNDPNYKEVLDRHRKFLAQWSRMSSDAEAKAFL